MGKPTRITENWHPSLDLEYRIIWSDRKFTQIDVTSNGVIVRTPNGTPTVAISLFLEERYEWIRKTLDEMEMRKQQFQSTEPLTWEEQQQLAQKASKVIPKRVKYYASRMGVSYGKITIRNQKRRWGSCTTKGNLNFNCLLMLMPKEAMDAIVVHELCHRKEMNHSKRFYQEVHRVYPEYDKWNQWIQEYGPIIMGRMP